MDQDRIWQAIDAQRSSLTDQLDGLTNDQWRRPSLCAGWTVRDVAAHLTLQQIRPWTAVVELVRARGNIDRLIHDAACRRAARPTADLIGGIRATIDSRRHNVGVTHLETLIDILVHGQDIMVPLGRQHEMPPDAAAVAADRVWALKAPFHARTKFDGYRLVATDTEWSVGDGPEVRGPMDALLLVLTGRLVALPRLSGEGEPALATRLSSPVSSAGPSRRGTPG